MPSIRITPPNTSLARRKGPARVLMTLGMGVGIPFLLTFAFGADGEAVIDALGSAGAAATYGGFYVAGYMIGRKIDAKRMRVVVVSPPPTDAQSHSGEPHWAEGECELLALAETAGLNEADFRECPADPEAAAPVLFDNSLPMPTSLDKEMEEIGHERSQDSHSCFPGPVSCGIVSGTD